MFAARKVTAEIFSTIIGRISSQKGRETLHGASGISTCPIRRPRVVVRASDLAVFQQLHEFIMREEKSAKILAQYWWAQVLSRVGFAEGNDIRDTSRVYERSC
jgi:hypothetical protein